MEWLHSNWTLFVGWSTLVFAAGVNVQMLRTNAQLLKELQSGVKEINGNVRAHSEALAKIEGVCPKLSVGLRGL